MTLPLSVPSLNGRTILAYFCNVRSLLPSQRIVQNAMDAVTLHQENGTMANSIALHLLKLLFMVRLAQALDLSDMGIKTEIRYVDASKLCNPGCKQNEFCCVDTEKSKKQRFCTPKNGGKNCYEAILGKTFLFGIEGAWEPYAFQDNKTGEAIGFLHDVIKALCAICGKKCDTVFIAEHLDRCYDPEKTMGEGLDNRHFDACIGWASTQYRRNTYSFYGALVEPTKAQVYVKKGSGMSKVEQLEGKTI
ncbi:unnamed protein product, partial [Owenia fusiformis]